MAARRITRLCVEGQQSWPKAAEVQATLVRRLLASSEHKDTLLLCEHPPTYTAGKRVAEDPMEEARLRALGAEYYRSKRGGDMTFHGPGQLVGYPIVDLTRAELPVRCYVDGLEEVLIRTCSDMGIKANRSPHTGVWVGDDKLAAIGVQISGRERKVASHGFAINCNTDMTWFRHFVPCGILDKGVTSFTELLGVGVTIGDIEGHIKRHYEDVFNTTLAESTALQDDVTKPSS